MSGFALALQLGGLLMAGVALVSEWRAERTLTPDGTVQTEPADRRDPYSIELAAKYVPASDAERSRWHHHNDWRDVDDRGRDSVDPDVWAFVNYLEDRAAERERLVVEDWRRQVEFDSTMRANLVQLVNEQTRLLREDRSATRRRVIVEGLGLTLAVLGTVLGQAT